MPEIPEEALKAAADAAREQALTLVAAALPETLDDVAKLARTVRSGDTELALLLADRMLDRHAGKAPATADEVAVRKILDTARAEIDAWKARATEYWNRAARDREQILQSEDAYGDLVGAGWTPPAWRTAQHRRAIEQEGGGYGPPTRTPDQPNTGDPT